VSAHGERVIDPGRLRAFSVALDEGPPIDPVALGGADGVLFAGPSLTLAGRGVAAVLPLAGGLEARSGLEAVADWLAAVAHTDLVGRPGSKVTALGALPFDRNAPGTLIVPELLFARDAGGHEWAVVVTEEDRPPDPAKLRAQLTAAGSGAHAPPPGGNPGALPTLQALPPPEGYEDAVNAGLGAIDAGAVEKVVLARCIDARMDAPPSAADVIRRLWSQEPTCTAFAYPVEQGRFLGVTPELLVARWSTQVTCHPLAGTVGLGGVSDEDAIARFLESTKDRTEHELVVKEIALALGPLCSRLDVPTAPSLVRLHSVAHLGTLIRGTLWGTPPASVLGLLADLHPTPAVAGVPRGAALELIADNEAVPRGHWAGPVGWSDAGGDGEWMIGIRSLTLAGTTARLCAGAGIVSGSVPHDELAETTVKLAPVLDALWPGSSSLLRR
jgi:isochorismate synthase